MGSPGDDATRLLFLLAQSARGGMTGAAGLGIAYWTHWEPGRINDAVEALRARGWVNVRAFPPAEPYVFHTAVITEAGMEAIEKAINDMGGMGHV
jgi:hypothetical protein